MTRLCFLPGSLATTTYARFLDDSGAKMACVLSFVVSSALRSWKQASNKYKGDLLVIHSKRVQTTWLDLYFSTAFLLELLKSLQPH